MPPLLVPLALLIVTYIPGWVTSRWLYAWTGKPLAPPALSPFPELVVGLGLTGWVGFLLAEAGVFSLPALVTIVLLYTGLLAVGVRRSAGARPPRRRLTTALVGGIAIGLVGGALYFPPYETIVMASDASIYLNTGIHIARSGSISVADPLVQALGFTERMYLFPVGWSDGWTRMPGTSLVKSGATEVVWPTYTHLLPVWVAIFHRLGGLEACALVITMFGALALWAIALFAAETRGWLVALVTVALVASNQGEFFFARFVMPEIATQFFLWAGLLAFVIWWREEWPAVGAVSALALGMTGFLRVEYLFFVPLALALQLGLTARHPRGVRVFVGVYGALLAHAVAHLVLVPTHYRDVIRTQAVGLWTEVSELGAGTVAAGLAGAAVLAAIVLRAGAGRRVALRRGVALAAAGVWFAAFAYASWRRVAPDAIATLAAAVPGPLLAVGAVGLALWVRQALSGDRALAFPLLILLLVTGAFVYDPHVTPIEPWSLRRFVPVTVPLFYVLAATALHWLARRVAPRHPTVVTAVAGALLVLVNARSLARLYHLPIYPEQKHQVRALADQIPPGGVIFFAPGLGDVGLHLPLWLVYDREGFVLPGWRWKPALRWTAPVFLPSHPVFYVDEATDPAPSVEGLRFTPRTSLELRFVVPDSDPVRAPSGATEWRLPLRVYQVGGG